MPLVPKHIEKLSPYKPGKTIESVKREYRINNIIKLASNENPLGPSIESLNAVKNQLHHSHRYPDASGLVLRQKLSNMFQLKVENVVLGSGSEGIMSSIMRTFLKENDELISAENSFIGFRVLANASGKKVHWVPKINYKYNLSGMIDKINHNTKIIYIANPDNPTGTYINKNEFDIFMKSVPNRVLVILDEAYFEYSQHIKDYPDSMLYRYDNVITLRTFSKVYGLAGFRVGYGFAHSELVDNLMKVKLPFEPSSSSQVAAIAALNDKSHLESTIRLNNLEMKKMYKNLDALNIKYVLSVANFIAIIFKTREEVLNCTKFLLKNGVIVRDLVGFGLPNCVRVTIGKANENKIFIDKLAKFLKK